MSISDVALHRLAERQHGLVTRGQARAAGLTDRAWRYRRDRGDWISLTARVARKPGAPVTLQQRTLAAVLDVGPSSYVSHRSAAALWLPSTFEVEPIELVVLRGGRETASTLAVTHRPRHLTDPFAAELDAIPVVRPALVLLQLAAVVPPARLRRLLDRMWSRHLLSGPSVRRELAGLMHRGRPGTAALRELLDSLPENYVPPASGLEGRLAELTEQAGLPAMRRQVDLGDQERWCGRVDFVAHDLPLVVEVDSERYHTALTDRAADAERQRRLEDAGYRVVRFTETDVWQRPARTVETLRQARAELRTRRQSAPPAA